MKTTLNERPSVLAPAYAPGLHAATHAYAVGQSAVWGHIAVSRQESVQSIRTRVESVQLAPDQGTNGFVAKTSGMAKVTRKGGTASGIPPRERQV